MIYKVIYTIIRIFGKNIEGVRFAIIKLKVKNAKTTSRGAFEGLKIFQ